MHVGHEFHQAANGRARRSPLPSASTWGRLRRAAAPTRRRGTRLVPIGAHPARSVGATRAGTWRLRYPSASLPPRAASRAPRAAERTRTRSRLWPAPAVSSPIAAAAAVVRWSRVPASSPGAATTSTSTVEPRLRSTRYIASLPSALWRNTPAVNEAVSRGRTSRSRTATSLSLRPAGLADGLALKESRYSRMSPRDSPQHRGSPAPSRPARDSACAGQPTSLQRRLQEYISNSRKLRPFARRTAPAARSTASRSAANADNPLARPPAGGQTVRSSLIDRLMSAVTAAPSGRAPWIAVAGDSPMQLDGRSGAQQTRIERAPELGPAPSRGQRPCTPGCAHPAAGREP